MTDINFTELFLTGMLTYGPSALGVALLLGALGLPVPGTLFVLAAGAFVRQGVIDGPTAALLAVVGATAGDSASYAVGRFAGGWVQSRFGQSSAWQSARQTFDRRGGLAVYLTRFLLTPLAIPTNLIAGGSSYAFLKFLTYDLAGEITWVALFGTLGYVFGTQWELVSEFISNFSGLLVGIAALAVGIYLLVRQVHHSRAAVASTPPVQ
ncbi:MAG: DedA family protein [Chloroflexi bacterium]|nr:MAG: DedA family protein [Chloroflexota bacterium]